MTNKCKVVVYARVSTETQNTDRQVNDLTEIANNHGWTIVDYYVDKGVSGSKTKRPELDRMMKDANSRKFDKVLTTELTRLGRNTLHLHQIAEFLKQKKIELFIQNLGLDTGTIFGECFFSITSALATLEKNQLRERVMSGLATARKKGRIGGRPTNLTDEVKSNIIQMREQGCGVRKIATHNKVGITTVQKIIRNVA